MSWVDNLETITHRADSDCSGHKFKVVEVNSAGNIDVANNTSFGYGILQNQPKSGEAATVAIEGYSKALAAGAVYPGQYVKNSSGWCTPVTSGGALATQVILGRAVTGAASGGQFTLALDPQLLVTSGGAMP